MVEMTLPGVFIGYYERSLFSPQLLSPCNIFLQNVFL